MRFEPGMKAWAAYPNDPSQDSKFFQKWLQVPKKASRYTDRILSNLAKTGLERVNCWVHQENLEADLARCMEEYEQVTGQRIRDPAYRERRVWTETHHAKCSVYYNDATRHFVRQSNKRIFDYFG